MHRCEKPCRTPPCRTSPPAKPSRGERCRIGRVHDLNLSAMEQPRGVRPREGSANAGARPDKTDHFMSAGYKRADGRTADGSGSSQKTYALTPLQAVGVRR